MRVIRDVGLLLVTEFKGGSFSTGAAHTMDKLFEGIRSITTRIYEGLVIIEKGSANLKRFMGFWWAKTLSSGL